MRKINITVLGHFSDFLFHQLEQNFGVLQTTEVVITDERIQHIQERHPLDYELFELYGESAIFSPDLLIRDEKHKGTVFAIKQLPETNLNVVVRLVLESDEPGFKNSVMTFYRIRSSNLAKLLKKNELLYKKE